ncbi:unnamed protein product [Gadus morhua 'NCC']
MMGAWPSQGGARGLRPTERPSAWAGAAGRTPLCWRSVSSLLSKLNSPSLFCLPRNSTPQWSSEPFPPSSSISCCHGDRPAQVNTGFPTLLPGRSDVPSSKTPARYRREHRIPADVDAIPELIVGNKAQAFLRTGVTWRSSPCAAAAACEGVPAAAASDPGRSFNQGAL